MLDRMNRVSQIKNGVKGCAKAHMNLFDPAVFRLISEIGLNFFRFLKSTDILCGSDFVVLSPKDDYSCNGNELKNARILITHKKLNLIKHLDLFLNSLVRILPPDTSLIGYFSGEMQVKGERYNPLFFPHSVIRAMNFFSRKRKHGMGRSEILELLAKNGFKTVNMRDMNGLTYFISRNAGQPV